MTAAFLLAVTTTFAFNAKSNKTLGLFSFYAQGTCLLIDASTDQAYCDVSFTGPQCTYNGLLIYYYDDSTWLPPTCTVPLRRPF